MDHCEYHHQWPQNMLFDSLPQEIALHMLRTRVRRLSCLLCNHSQGIPSLLVHSNGSMQRVADSKLCCSGHTASAFLVGTFLALYLNAKLKAFSSYHTSFWKMLVVLSPVIGAAFIAGSLVSDHASHTLLGYHALKVADTLGNRTITSTTFCSPSPLALPSLW